MFHLIGMVFMIGCALLISFSKEGEGGGVIEIYGDIVPEISPVWGVIFAILTTFLFFVRTMTMKIYYHKFRYDPMNLTLVSYIVQGIVMIFIVFTMELATFEVMFDNILAGG